MFNSFIVSWAYLTLSEEVFVSTVQQIDLRIIQLWVVFPVQFSVNLTKISSPINQHDTIVSQRKSQLNFLLTFPALFQMKIHNKRQKCDSGWDLEPNFPQNITSLGLLSSRCCWHPVKTISISKEN